MTRLVSALVALGISLGLTITAADPIMDFYTWAAMRLDSIGAAERERQQDIQDLVCEAENLSPCPTVPRWTPVEQQVEEMSPPVMPATTTTTLATPVTLL